MDIWLLLVFWFFLVLFSIINGTGVSFLRDKSLDAGFPKEISPRERTAESKSKDLLNDFNSVL